MRVIYKYLLEHQKQLINLENILLQLLQRSQYYLHFQPQF